MNADRSIIYVMENDKRIRESLTDMLSSAINHVMTFGSATEYLNFFKPEIPACLILDLQLPEMNGLQLQQELALSDGPPMSVTLWTIILRS